MIFGSSTNMGIGIAVTLRDRFSAKAGAVTASMSRMHSNVKQVLRDNLSAVRNLSAATAGAGLLMLAPLANAVKAGSEFNYLMSSVKAVTQATNTELSGLHDLSLNISKETIHTANEVADAMKYLGHAGFKADQIAASIRGVSILGAATDTQIAGKGGAADILSNIMQQFNLGANQSIKVADVLTNATTNANTNLKDLGQAIYYSGGAFNALNVPMHEAIAMLSVLSGSGYSGSFAGTAVQNMLQQLSKALGEFRTGRQSKVLDKIGLRPEDVLEMRGGVVQLKSLVTIMDVLGKKMDKGVVGAQQIDALFQKRGARAFLAALREPKVGKGLKDMVDLLQNFSQGRALDVANEKINNHYGQVKIMQSAWNTFKISIAEALIPVLVPLIKMFTWIANIFTRITNNPIGKVFVIAAVAVGALITVGASLLLVFTQIKLMSMASGVTFANMGRSLTWAWNSSAAAALRYRLVAKGIGNDIGFNAAGRWVNKKTGKFVKTPKGAGGLSVDPTMLMSRGFFKNIGRNLSKFGRYIAKSLPWLGRLARIGTIVGAIIAALEVVFGGGNLLKGIGWGFSFLMHSVIYLGKVIWGVLSNIHKPWTWGTIVDKAGEDWMKGVRKTTKELGFEEPWWMEMAKKNRNALSDHDIGTGYSQEFLDTMDKALGAPRKSGYYDSIAKPKPVIQTQVNLNGNALGNYMGQMTDEMLEQLTIE